MLSAFFLGAELSIYPAIGNRSVPSTTIHYVFDMPSQYHKISIWCKSGQSTGNHECRCSCQPAPEGFLAGQEMSDLEGRCMSMETALAGDREIRGDKLLCWPSHIKCDAWTCMKYYRWPHHLAYVSVFSVSSIGIFLLLAPPRLPFRTLWEIFGLGVSLCLYTGFHQHLLAASRSDTGHDSYWSRISLCPCRLGSNYGRDYHRSFEMSSMWLP